MDENKAKQIQQSFLQNTMEDYHSKLQHAHDSAPDEETRKKIRQDALQRHINMQNSLKSQGE